MFIYKTAPRAQLAHVEMECVVLLRRLQLRPGLDGLDLVEGIPEFAFVAAPEYHVGAFLGEPRCDREADAACGTGDGYGFACEGGD